MKWFLSLDFRLAPKSFAIWDSLTTLCDIVSLRRLISYLKHLPLCMLFPFKLVYYKYQSIMSQAQSFDDCFEIELPIKKISQIIFMSSSQLLVIHSPSQYTLIQILNRNQIKTVKVGRLPHLIQNIKKISEQSICFILQNQLHVFDLLKEKIVTTYAIARSSIYLEQFHYEIYDSSDKMFLFYKTSILKGTPINIYYEIYLLHLKENFQKIKRLKCQHQDLRKFGYSCGQIFSYQLSGYQIEVIFLQSGITHKVQSIFNLFLIQIKSNPEEIILNFSHDELENEWSIYKVTKKKVSKMNRTVKSSQKHTTYNDSKLRSIVFKNCFNHRKQDPNVAIFRVNMSKQSKILHLMENGLQEQVSNEFKQLVLNLCLK